MNDEMYSLLARYFSGQVTDPERQAVHSWAEASEENRKELAFFKEIWEKSGEPVQAQFDAEAAWQKVKAAITETKKQSSRVFRLRTMIAAAAAAVLLFFVITRFFTTGAKYEKITATAAVQDVLLEDGSHVYLRKGSELRYPKKFPKDKREVALTGEAFFDIARNPEKPFTINAASTNVTVLGTSFMVHTSADSLVEVTVKTGLVKFALATDTLQQVKLAAGEKGIYRQQKITRESNTDSNFDSWQTGRIQFTNTPVKQALQTLGRHFNVLFTIKKEDEANVAAITLTTMFTNQPLEEVIKELEMITSFRIKKMSDTVYEINSQ